MSAQEYSRRKLLIASGAVLTGLTAGGMRSVLAAEASGAAAGARASGTLTLGKDMTVRRLGFGAMRVTGEGIWGPPKDPAEARRVLQCAVELGVDFIDTADAYGPGISEDIIAAALHPYPAGLVIATKGGLTRPSAPQWVPDGRPEHLRAACEASLRRLKIERIDLYQLHAIDEAVPLEDSVGELARLQKEGKIRHVGVSNFDVAELARARRVVEVVSVQNQYNVVDRSSDPVLEVCERDGIAFIPWRPLGTGARDAVADGPAARLAKVAERHAISMPQAAIAWTLARSPVMLPIPGTSQLRHLEENVAAGAVKLTAAEMSEIG